MRGNSLLVLAACFALASPACDRFDNSPTGASVKADVKGFVAASAAESLAPDGTFRFAPARAPADIPIINAQRAGELAHAYVRTFGPYQLGSWAYQRGAPLSLDRLEMDPRILYAETPHERFPDTYHPAAKRHFGPMYLVHFRTGGEVVLTVAVAAYASDLEIDDHGRVVEPMLGGGYFHPAAVSIDPAHTPVRYVPVSPEDAVEQVAKLTGARVVEVPQLILPSRLYHAVFARWKLVLDRPVRVKPKDGAGPPAMVRELYVGAGRTLWIPSAVQTPFLRVPHTTGPTQEQGGPPMAETDLPRRKDLPIDFDAVVIASQE